EVHDGEKEKHLQPGVQGGGSQAGDRERAVGGGGGPLLGHPREPAALLEAGPGEGRQGPGRGLPRTRQPPRPGGGDPEAQGGERASEDGARPLKKSDGVLRQGGDVTFSFIEEHRTRWPVTLMCEVFGVSTSGFYAWLSRPESEQERRRQAILCEIRQIH